MYGTYKVPLHIKGKKNYELLLWHTQEPPDAEV